MKRILVVRRDNIGDLVCTTPLLAALRRCYPGAWLGTLVNSYNAPVLDNNPDLDSVIAYTKLKHLEVGQSRLGALGGRLRDLWALRRRKLDCVVLATPDFSSRTLKLARALAPEQLVGFSDGSAAARGLDRSVPVAALEGKHEVERVFALAPLLGIDGAPPPLRLIASQNEVARAAQAFGGKATIAVHISARRASQRWNAENFVSLIERIGRSAQVALLWSPGAASHPQHPGDDEKAAGILARSPAAIGYRTERLPELIAALAACDAVLCADGGAMHLAAGLGKPVVALFGDSPATRWRPWGVPNRVLQPASRDVRDITPDEAAAALASLRAGDGT